MPHGTVGNNTRRSIQHSETGNHERIPVTNTINTQSTASTTPTTAASTSINNKDTKFKGGVRMLGRLFLGLGSKKNASDIVVVAAADNTKNSNSINVNNILELLRNSSGNTGDHLSDHLADLRLLVAAAENPLHPLSKQYDHQNTNSKSNKNNKKYRQKTQREQILEGRLSICRTEIKVLRDEIDVLNCNVGNSQYILADYKITPRIMLNDEDDDDEDIDNFMMNSTYEEDEEDEKEEKDNSIPNNNNVDVGRYEKYIEYDRNVDDFTADSTDHTETFSVLSNRHKKKRIKRKTKTAKQARIKKKQRKKKHLHVSKYVHNKPLSPKQEVEFVLHENSNLIMDDMELEHLRKELVEIILGSHLYGKGSDSSSNLQEEILNVVARSTLGSSAAYTLLRELEEQLPGILPFV